MCGFVLCFAYTNGSLMSKFVKNITKIDFFLSLKSSKSLIKTVPQYPCEGERTEL